MSDTYISKVTGIVHNDTFLHHCGTISVGVEVECPMAERLLYCPDCDVFWGVDEDYWGDKETKWDVEKPGPQTNYIQLNAQKDSMISRFNEKIQTKNWLLSENHRKIEAQEKRIYALEQEANILDQKRSEMQMKIDEQLKEEGELRDLIRRYNELVGELRQHYPANNEVLDEMENRILGPME